MFILKKNCALSLFNPHTQCKYGTSHFKTFFYSEIKLGYVFGRADFGFDCSRADQDEIPAYGEIINVSGAEVRSSSVAVGGCRRCRYICILCVHA